MPAFDLENNDSFQFTILDESRLECAEPGDTIDGENGDFKVLVYKDSYLLFLMNERLIRAKKLINKEFKTLKSLVSFLKK